MTKQNTNARGRLVVPDDGEGYDDSVDLDTLNFERRETPVGFGPTSTGLRTELKFDPDLHCMTCKTPLEKTGPGAFRFACSCRSGRGREPDVEESEETQDSGLKGRVNEQNRG